MGTFESCGSSTQVGVYKLVGGWVCALLIVIGIMPKKGVPAKTGYKERAAVFAEAKFTMLKLLVVIKVLEGPCGVGVSTGMLKAKKASYEKQEKEQNDALVRDYGEEGYFYGALGKAREFYAFWAYYLHDTITNMLDWDPDDLYEDAFGGDKKSFDAAVEETTKREIFILHETFELLVIAQDKKHVLDVKDPTPGTDKNYFTSNKRANLADVERSIRALRGEKISAEQLWGFAERSKIAVEPKVIEDLRIGILLQGYIAMDLSHYQIKVLSNPKHQKNVIGPAVKLSNSAYPYFCHHARIALYNLKIAVINRGKNEEFSDILQNYAPPAIDAAPVAPAAPAAGGRAEDGGFDKPDIPERDGTEDVFRYFARGNYDQGKVQTFMQTCGPIFVAAENCKVNLDDLEEWQTANHEFKPLLRAMKSPEERKFILAQLKEKKNITDISKFIAVAGIRAYFPNIGFDVNNFGYLEELYALFDNIDDDDKRLRVLNCFQKHTVLHATTVYDTVFYAVQRVPKNSRDNVPTLADMAILIEIEDNLIIKAFYTAVAKPYRKFFADKAADDKAKKAGAPDTSDKPGKSTASPSEKTSVDVENPGAAGGAAPKGSPTKGRRPHARASDSEEEEGEIGAGASAGASASAEKRVKRDSKAPERYGRS